MRGRTLGEDSEEARQVQTWDRVFLRDRTFQVGHWGSGEVGLSKRLRLNWRALKWPWAYLLILFSFNSFCKTRCQSQYSEKRIANLTCYGSFCLMVFFTGILPCHEGDKALRASLVVEDQAP